MNKWLTRFIPTMAMLATTAAVLLVGVRPAHADTSAPADPAAYTVPEYTSDLGHGPMLYNGVDLSSAEDASALSDMSADPCMFRN